MPGPAPSGELPAAGGLPITPLGDRGPARGPAPVAPEGTAGGQPIVPALGAAPRELIAAGGELVTGGRPIGPTGGFGAAGEVIRSVGVPPAPTITGPTATFVALGAPVGGLASTFNIFGAPIAILGGVFTGGLPIGGPVSQIFRGGSAPMPNTLFINTISPGGPIGNFFIGSGGAPIGVDTFGGGGLAIQPPAVVAIAIAEIGPLTAAVTAPALVFGEMLAAAPGSPIFGG